MVDRWLSSAVIDDNHKTEIHNLDEKELEDRFYKELEFGTGGLRGVIGAGTNRMNIYTVGKVTQGYANFLKSKYNGEDISVAIAYDSRIKSDEFAKRSALIFSANGIKVYLYESLRPTPMLSFALRELKCKGGVVITASHNPKEYNGYKVYGEDGGQLTDELAKEVYSYISDVDIFGNVEIMNEDEAVNSKMLCYLDKDMDDKYISRVKDLVIRKDMVKDHSSELKIVYTPLHGVGYVPVTRVLSELGYSNVQVVNEQKDPDGKFTTVPYPNPELESVFELATKIGKNTGSDIIFATDPDCDRVGIVCLHEGNYRILTGNQVGVLLSEYILESMKSQGKLSDKSTIIKTIVTTDLIKDICEAYGVNLIEVLTGFKYIGEKIKEFEISGSNEYTFGFEESYGYLLGTFVRDKDAVIGVSIIAEMALYYKLQNKSLYDALMDLYKKYGFAREELISMELKGKEGQNKIKRCIDNLRELIPQRVGDKEVFKVQDYSTSLEKDLLSSTESKIDLPKSNVLKFILKDGSWFAIRPSGTEPKIKFYLGIKTYDEKSLDNEMKMFKDNVMQLIEKCMN